MMGMGARRKFLVVVQDSMNPACFLSQIFRLVVKAKCRVLRKLNSSLESLRCEYMRRWTGALREKALGNEGDPERKLSGE